MWMIIKTIIVVAAVIWQFVIVYGAEAIAKESENYGQAIYELIWLLMLFYVGNSLLKEYEK